MPRTSKARILSSLIVILLIIGGFLLINRNSPIDSVNCGEDFKCWRNHYQKLVDKKSPKVALEDARLTYQQVDYVRSNCHQLAHVIGRAGGKKYKTVDEAYAQGNDFCWSGYYHGVMEAIATSIGNEKILTQLNDICAGLRADRQFSMSHYNCVHGLGHGLMVIQGNELFTSLESCDKLNDKWEQSSCWGGAFMENIMSELNPDHYTKYLKDDDNLYPCNAVDDKYKGQCFLMQTSHVLKLNGYDFPQAFQVCGTVADPYDKVCYTSMGRDASGSTISDPQKTRDICLKGHNDEAKEWCIVGAVKDFISYHHALDPGLEFCEVLYDNKLKDRCISEAQTTASRL